MRMPNILKNSISYKLSFVGFTPENLPFEIDKSTLGIDEELRLKYRYLDLRSERMNKNITLRHEIVRFMREYLYKKDFREIETPFLTKSTPEGAREFIGLP